MTIESTQAEPLDEWLKTRSTLQLSAHDTAHFICLAAELLQTIHDQHKLYLDVRPHNVLVLSNETATSLPGIQLAHLDEKTPRAARGTPLYMAPEQWAGRPQAASDQYALAILAYQLLTGQTPFSGDDKQLKTQHHNSAPQPPSMLNKRLSAAIDVVILRALAKKPERRFPSVTSFAQALHQAADYSDLHSTLILSPEEAQNGTERTIMLPGKRQVTLAIPTQVHNRQILRISGKGEEYYAGGPRGALVLTLSIQNDPQADSNLEDTTLQKSLPKSAPSTATAASPTPISGQDVDTMVLPDPPVTPPTLPAYQQSPETQRMPTLQAPSVTVVPVAQPAQALARPLKPAQSPRSKRPAVILVSPSHARPLSSRARAWFLIAFALLVALAGLATYIIYFRLHITTWTSLQHFLANYQTVGAASNATLDQNTPTPPAVTSTPASPQDNPYSKAASALVLNDPLANNSKQAQWQLISMANGTCQFGQDAYVIDSTKNGYPFLCTANGSAYAQLQNFAYEAQMTIVRGDAGGISFRLTGTNTVASYYFRVSQDGHYALLLLGPINRVLASGASSAIVNGLGNTNTLAVVVNGNKIDLYINHIYVTTVTDTSYTQGQIALVADDLTTSTEVKFNNVRLWTL